MSKAGLFAGVVGSAPADNAPTDKQKGYHFMQWDTNVITETDKMILEFDLGGATSLTIGAVGVLLTYNAVIEWGDGNESTVTAYNDANLSHTYAGTGVYTVKIKGQFPAIRMGTDKLLLKKILNFGATGCETLFEAFRSSGLTSVSSTYCDASLIESMARAFEQCGSLLTVSLGEFDSSPLLVSTNRMFSAIPATSIDLGTLDTSAVTDFKAMFFITSSLSSLNAEVIDMTSATELDGMFSTTTASVIDVSAYDVSNVLDMTDMFAKSPNISALNVSLWDTSKVTKMLNMFRFITTLPDIAIDNWNIGQVTNLTTFIDGAGALTTARYDATLIAWEAQAHQPNVVAGFGSSTYTLGGAAETARTALIADGWTITDSGGI